MRLIIFRIRFINNATDQKHVMDIIYSYCMEHPKIIPSIWIIFYQLYDQEVLEEDIIKEWFYSPRPLADNIKAEIKKLIDWLETAEEDDSDD